MKKLEVQREVKKRSIPTLSLFTGAGGLDIGFHNAGFEIVGCVEIEEDYCKTLEENKKTSKYLSPSTKIHCMDIRSFIPEEYAEAGIQCIIGGPPCQTFSAAGRRSGGVLGTKDKRGKLFETYCYILSVLKPKVFVFENVYGLPGANGGGPWNEIVNAFSELGYILSFDVLDAADYGVPQHRERLIIVGSLDKEYCFPEPTHGPDSQSGIPLFSVLDAISDLQCPDEPEHEFDGLYGHLLSLVPEGLNYSFFTREMGYPKPYFAWRSKFHDFLYKVDRNTPCRTIKAQPGKFTGPLHWKNRHFTANELKRLQSFPDNYELVGSFSKVVGQIGNSVPPKLAEVLAVSVREQLFCQDEILTYKIRNEHFKSTFRQRQRERSNHYKKVAALEISMRFPNVELFEADKKKVSQKYIVSYQSLFRKEIYKETNFTPEAGTTTFSVTTIDEGDRITIKVCRVGGAKSKNKKMNVEILGLSKYLITTDRVSVEANVASLDDVFKVWDLIQERLTSTSQFFTLIDIYGHYANRGDTVRICTKLTSGKRDLVAKAINYFGKSENCGYFIGRQVVAEALDVSISHVDEVVQRLRELRFDIRTSQTHRTINTNDIICTYPFPLLSDKAQLERRNKA